MISTDCSNYSQCFASIFDEFDSETVKRRIISVCIALVSVNMSIEDITHRSPEIAYLCRSFFNSIIFKNMKFYMDKNV